MITIGVNASKAAAALGLTRQPYVRIRKHGLDWFLMR